MNVGRYLRGEDATEELNCAEAVLEAIHASLPDEALPQTHFDCIGDYITAVVDAVKSTTQNLNLSCPSVQARLAAQWGYVEAQEPMTPASRDVIMATRTANADADEWPEPWAYQRGWNNAEAHHGITTKEPQR